MKFALAFPAGTVTDAGTLPAAGLLLCSDTETPPVGAGPVKATVPVDELPPTTLDGLRVNEPSAGGVMVNRAEAVVPYVPEMFATVEDATGLVVTLKVATVAPAATVTLVGTTAAELSLAKVIVTPLLGAGPLMVTVPVEPVPPITLLGLRVTELTLTGTGVTFN